MKPLIDIINTAKITVTGYDLKVYIEKLFVEKFENAIAYIFSPTKHNRGNDIYLLNKDDLTVEIEKLNTKLYEQEKNHAKKIFKIRIELEEYRKKFSDSQSEVNDVKIEICVLKEKLELAKPWWKRRKD